MEIGLLIFFTGLIIGTLFVEKTTIGGRFADFIIEKVCGASLEEEDN